MKFISNFALVAAVVSGYMMLIALAISVFIFVVDEGVAVVAGNFSGAQLFFVENVKSVVVGYALFSTLAFASAVGLRHGRRWAYWSWVGLLAIAIGWLLFVFSLEVRSLLVYQEAPGHSRFVGHSFSMIILPLTAAAGVFFAWLLRRLLSARDCLY